ncbi:hypothetical protein SanaruYs_34300 [Chryseotalea sanaruensis]|uniref:FlgO domain-containing protein n=1 Tax=Chryseotalea sanaruensis TaxID=2482724 RepID=A0A401UE90_9BACT|nr:FlgO family outer membrane protein [Chryseotalea sanaruensis]GCC53187.1 hypothetical protein SanaruYs_34300 [Chryseotalea sanaruensis]
MKPCISTFLSKGHENYEVPTVLKSKIVYMKYALLILIFCSGIVYGQKPRNYAVVTNELTQKLINVPVPKSPMRLGIVPFTATKSSIQNSPQFGEYLTETIMGQVGNYTSKVKLFERTRLDAILKEQELELSDLMKPAAALKIGQLAPIDVILSGTYTKLKTYVDVSARLLDVSSGEVLMSFAGRIKVDKNLATLFKEPTSKPTPDNTLPAQQVTSPAINVTINNANGVNETPKPSVADLCKIKVKEFRTKLSDLSTQQKIDAVASEAMQTAFDNSCGLLHFDVMYTFSRYKIQQGNYNRFLMQTLDTIAYPTKDDRALEIIRFLVNDEQLQEAEWESAFSAISRIGNYWLSNYLDYLLARPSNTAVDVSKTRIDDFFSVVSNGKLGLPLPISKETAYFEMMEGLKKNQGLRQYVYERYSKDLMLDDKHKATFFSELTSMYKEEENEVRKSEIIQWIAEFINQQDYPKASEQLYDFAWHFKLTTYEERNNEIKRDYPEAELKKLVELSRNRFAQYAVSTPYQSQQEDRLNFCVKYDIPVPGVIPTLEEAEKILKGSIVSEQLKVMKFLTLKDDAPRILEPTLVAFLAHKSLDERSDLLKAQTLAIEVLGNCKTTNRTAINFMIAALPNYGNDTEAAKDALVKIGKPAVAPLQARLDKTTIHEGGLQFQLITLLGKIGKDAAPATKSIQRILDSSTNKDVRYAAEAALQAIK